MYFLLALACFAQGEPAPPAQSGASAKVPPATEKVASEPQTSPEPTNQLGNRAEVVLRYIIIPEGDVRSATITTVIPNSIPNVQTVESVELRPALCQRFEQGGNSYVRFVVTKPTKPTEISVKLRLSVLPNDLTAVRARGSAELTLSEEERAQFTRAEPFLESDSESIGILAARVTEKDEIGRVRTAIDLAVGQLKVGPFNGADLGALAALRAHRGDCTDFADLSTAILRAAKVPSRRVSGFLLEYDTTPKHDWFEVHIERLGWVPFDPSRVKRSADSFDRLKPIYIRTSILRNDPSLSGFHYFKANNDGGKIRIEDSFEVISVSPLDAK